MWSHRLTNRPENQMSGVSFTRGGYARLAGATPAAAGGYTIYRHEHWALTGTGLSYGDQLGAQHTLIGFEVDGCELQLKDGLPYPTGSDGTPMNFEIIALAPAALWDREMAPPGVYPDDVLCDLDLVCLQVLGDTRPETLARLAHGHAVMGTYTSARGGTVFTGGTTEWVYALGDLQVSRITRNVIRQLSGAA